MKDKIVVNVVGGIVQGIWSDNPNIEVKLFDYDVFDYDKTNQYGQTEKQQEKIERNLIKNMKAIY